MVLPGGEGIIGRASGLPRIRSIRYVKKDKKINLQLRVELKADIRLPAANFPLNRVYQTCLPVPKVAVRLTPDRSIRDSLFRPCGMSSRTRYNQSPRFLKLNSFLALLS
jgi:hypothetical protein